MKHIIAQSWVVLVICSIGGYFLHESYPIPADHLLVRLTDQSEWYYWLRYILFLFVFMFTFTTYSRVALKIMLACYLSFQAYVSGYVLEQYGIIIYSVHFATSIIQVLILWFALHYRGLGWLVIYLVVFGLDFFFL